MKKCTIRRHNDFLVLGIVLTARSSTSFRNLMNNDGQLSNPAFMGVIQFGGMGPGPQTLSLWERKLIRRYLHLQNPPIFIRTLVENASDDHGRLIVTVTHWKITLRYWMVIYLRTLYKDEIEDSSSSEFFSRFSLNSRRFKLKLLSKLKLFC